MFETFERQDWGNKSEKLEQLPAEPLLEWTLNTFHPTRFKLSAL
jgi:hypothetical protein